MKNLCFLTAILITIFAPSCWAEVRPKIAFSIALTGDAATYGNDMRRSFMFANEKLAGNRYDLVFEDDQCNGKAAVTVAHKFINVLRIPYVLGFACSSTVLSTASLYEKAKTVVITSSASAAAISQAGDFVFRTFPSDAGAAKKLFDTVETKVSSLAILSEQTEYAQGFAQNFVENNTKQKLRIVQENYLPETTDFRSLLLRLKQRNIGGLFINSQTEASFLRILEQVRELKWKVVLYGAYWPGSAAFLQKAHGQAEGIVFVDTPQPNDVLNEEGQRLYEEFIQRHGKLDSIELVFASSFEAFRALTTAIESGQEMRSYLYSTKFQGLFGEWSFDKNGEIQGLGFVIKRIENGTPRTLP